MMKILHLSDLHVEPVGKLAYARANTARRMIELTEWLASIKMNTMRLQFQAI